MSTAAMQPVPDDAEVLQTVHDAVLALPGVVDLHAGTFGEVGTYLPGKRIKGVRRSHGEVEVHITVLYGPSVLDVADAVRAAAEPVVHCPVSVMVEDVIEAGKDV